MLKVYMVGLIYFNGCDEEEKRAFAPDGRVAAFGVRPHFASLWVKANQVNLGAGATQWPERQLRSIDGVDVIEFRILEPVEIVFPDQNNPLSCADLDAVMPKLKKDKKKDEDEEYFAIDPVNARTIATVTIGGGRIVPFEMKKNKKFGLVEWTIDNPSGLQITAGERSITLMPGVATEVVFSNIHAIDLNANLDTLADDDHIQLFKQLNPALGEGVTLVAHKPGNLPRAQTNNALLKRLEDAHFTCGETPPCCARIVMEGND